MTNLCRRAALILSAGLIASATFALPVHAAAGHQARAATLSRSSQSLAGRQARTGAGAWRLARTFSARGNDVVLAGIDAVGPADAWVAGTIDREGLTLRALIGHWNGSAWARAAVPPMLAARFRGQDFGALGASSGCPMT